MLDVPSSGKCGSRGGLDAGCAHRADCTVVAVGDIVDFTGYSAHDVLYARLSVCGLPVSISERSEIVGTPAASVPARRTLRDHRDSVAAYEREVSMTPP